MNRRELLQCAALISSGATQIPAGWALSQPQKKMIAARQAYIQRAQAQLFSERQRAIAAAVAEHIIPHTDSPGAIDAGVPRFIEAMVGDWFTPQEREQFLAGLDELNEASGGFLALSPIQQLSLLEQLEEQASGANWYQLGNVLRVWDSEAPFICQFKELTVLGFMLSEQGATRLLRPNPMGKFNGDIPLKEGDKAYASARAERSVSPPIAGIGE